MSGRIVYSLLDLRDDEIRVVGDNGDEQYVIVDYVVQEDSGPALYPMHFDRETWDALAHCVELAFIDAGEGGD